MSRDWSLDDMAVEDHANEKSSLLDRTADRPLATDALSDKTDRELRGRKRRLAFICSFTLIVLVLRIVLAIELLQFGPSGSSIHHHDTHLAQAHKLLKETPLIGWQT